MRKKLLFLIVAVSLVFSLVACNETTGETTTVEGQTTETTEAEPVVLTMLQGYDGGTQNFNPYTTSSYMFANGFMYEYLCIFDTLNGGEEHMWLAESIVSDPDNVTLTINVRQGIKWSDGEDFTAEDVAYSYTVFRDNPAIDFYGIWGDYGLLVSVTVVDDYTVEVVARYPNKYNRMMLVKELPIIPEHIFEPVEDVASFVLETPVVTGSFSEVIEFTNEMVVLGRNPYYWKGEELKIDQLRIPAAGSMDAMLALLDTGQIDWMHGFVPNMETTYIQGHEERKYWYGPGDGLRIAFNYMTDNEDNLKAFTDPEFKKALSLAVDRQGIVDSALFGYVDLLVPTATGLPPGAQDYINPAAQAITDTYTTYNLDLARPTLAAAGYVDIDGDGVVENPDGTPISFEILTPTGWADWNDGCAIAVQGFREIGVDATAVTADSSLVYESWGTGEHDALYTSFGTEPNIWRFYFDTIGDQSRFLTPTWWSTCQTNYKNDEISGLIMEMATATDERALEISNYIELFFAENVINIPIIHNGFLHVYSEERFTGWATAENPFVHPASVISDTKILQLLALVPVE